MQNPIKKLETLKNWKLWRVPTTLEFNIVYWNLAHVS